MDVCFHKNPENLGFSGNIRWVKSYHFSSLTVEQGKAEENRKKSVSPYVFQVTATDTIKSLHSGKTLV